MNRSFVPHIVSFMNPALRKVLVAVLLLSAALLSKPASAACWFYSNDSTQYETLHLPAQLNVARDVAPGTVLYTSVLVPAYRGSNINDSFAWCDAPGTIYKNTLAPLGPASAGSQQNVAKTNVRGIGVRFVMKNDSGTSYGWVVDSSGNPTGSYVGRWGWYEYGPGYWGIEIVKTNEPIESGVVDASSIRGRLRLDNIHAVELTIAGATTVQGYSCSTPDVVVPLGQQKLSSFGGVGSKIATRDFAISVNGCPSGLKSIKYQLNPVDGVLNASQAVATLSPGAAAGSGFGVQVTDRSNNPITFAANRSVPGYTQGATGNFTIPLRASYYKSATTVKAGIANANIEFTMTYE